MLRTLAGHTRRERRERQTQQDARRTARLLFDAELSSGTVDERAVDAPTVARALDAARLPPHPLRIAQRAAMKARVLTYDRNSLRPLVRARHAVLGDSAAGPPRFLVRVDEFPNYDAYDRPEVTGIEASQHFHSIMAEAGMSYLMAVLPQLTHNALEPHASGGRPLGDDEIAFLQQMAADGVTFAQHGTTHRTRHPSARRRSEFHGLSAAQAGGVIDQGKEALARVGLNPRVFVPPFNRFNASQYDALAARFDVVCGGSASVPLLGFHRTPCWWRGAVYLPAYEPLYGTAAEILPAVEDLLAREVGCWVPVVLHLAWEAEAGWTDLIHLARRLAPYASSWEDFLIAVGRSRA